MVSASVETQYFDSCKRDLLDHHAGKFAIVCGRKLLGVHDTLEKALRAAGEAFGEGLLEDGAPILITEIAESAKLRVVAEPRALGR
jgi:hypothetical protein